MSRFVAALLRRSGVVVLTALLVVIVGTWLTARLTLRPGIDELLPADDLAALALGEAARRMGPTATVNVIVEAPTGGGEAVAVSRSLAARIAALGPTRVELAVWGSPTLRAFAEHNQWLYADLPELEAVRDRLVRAVASRKNPLLVDLDEDAQRSGPTDAAARASRADAWLARFPGGALVSPDGKVAAIVVLPASGDHDAEGLLAALRGVIAAEPLPAGVRVSLAGALPAAVEERQAILGDVALSTGLVALLVTLVVWLYFGRFRAVALVALPAAAGTLIALGAASIAYGSLNLSTAFLAPIIVGNGINYPILLLARYEEERRRGRVVADALDVAVRGTMRATLLAAGAAALAYASLGLVRSRGMSEFGLLGGAGMLLCWGATMTLLPALVWRIDRRRAVAAAPRRRLELGAPFAWLAERAPSLGLAAGAALSVAAAMLVPRWLADPFQYDLARLRTVVPTNSGAELDPLVGRALSPALLLAPSREAARAAAVEVRRRADAAPGTVAAVVTLDDLLPGSPAEQRRKLAVIDDIRRRLADPLVAEHAPELSRRRPPDDLRVLSDRDLPELARRPFRERDGALGRIALVISPQENFSVYRGQDLMRLARVIGDVPVVVGDGRTTHLHAASAALVFADLLDGMYAAGPRATLTSLALVALLTALLLRRRGGALLVLACLALGVLWMLGVAALLDIKLDFLNLIALPITFGIGVDYAANLYLRYAQMRRAGGPRPSVAALRSTGGAVALNSLTTIIGYGSLLVAHNGALRGFGALAIVGEIACLSAALLLLPSLLALGGRARGEPSSATRRTT